MASNPPVPPPPPPHSPHAFQVPGAHDLSDPVELGRLVRITRQARGLTLQQVADAVGCAKSYLSQIERASNAGTPSALLLEKLEGLLQLSPGQLRAPAQLAGAGPTVRAGVRALAQRVHDQQQAAAQLRALLSAPGASGALSGAHASGRLRELIERMEGVIGGGETDAGAVLRAVALDTQVPLINSVAAGYPRDFTDLGYPARVSDESVRVSDVRDPDAFACRVVGDSMEPRYVEGDVVVFSPARAVRTGSDCFVRFEPTRSGCAESTFKRVELVRAGEQAAAGGDAHPTDAHAAEAPDDEASVTHIRLVALNPRYPVRTVEREQIAGLYPAIKVIRSV